MEFEWDKAKDAANRAKHGVAFTLIADFNWTTARFYTDDRLDYGEERQFARGMIGDRLYVAVFVLRGGAIRLISLRKANRRERVLYATETGT